MCAPGSAAFPLHLDSYYEPPNHLCLCYFPLRAWRIGGSHLPSLPGQPPSNTLQNMDGNQGRKQKRNKRKRKARINEGRGDHGRKHSTDGLVEAHETSTASHPETAAIELELRSDTKVAASSGDASSLVAIGTAEAANPTGDAGGARGTGGANASGTGGKKGKKRRRQEAAAALAAKVSKAKSNPPPTGDGDAAQSPKAKKTHGGRGINMNSRRATAAAAVQTEQTASVGRPSPPQRSSRGKSGGVSGGVGKGKGGAAGRGAPPLSDLQKRMRQKLEGAQFRMINEELYTSESGASLAKFEREPELFDVVRRSAVFQYDCFIEKSQPLLYVRHRTRI